MQKGSKFAVCVMSVLLGGCISVSSLMPEKPGDPAFAPSVPNPAHHARQRTGGIYSEATALNLFETNRARRVGDILTVTLDERFTGTKKATTTGKKKNATEIKNATSFGQPFHFGNDKNLGFSLDSTSDFNGEGESKQNNSLQGTISVTVYDVLSNGDLKIRGEKWLRINRGDEFVRLSGTIRIADISPENTISSQKIANARISYSGTGQVSDSNVQGWAARILNSQWWPY